MKKVPFLVLLCLVMLSQKSIYSCDQLKSDNKKIDCYIELLKSSNEAERNAANLKLGMMRSEKAVKPLVELLGSEQASEEEKRLAALSLSRIGDKEASPFLKKSLEKEHDNSTLQFIIMALGDLRDKSSSSSILNIYSNNEDPYVQVESVISLAKISYNKSLELVREFLRKSEHRARRKLFEALEYINNKNETHLILVEGTKDSLDEVRVHAIYHLGQEKTYNNATLIINILKNDSSPIVKEQALLSLGQIGDKNAIPEIAKYVSDSKLADSSIKALGMIKDSSVLNILQAELSGPYNIDYKNTVIESLAKINDEKSSDILLEELIKVNDGEDFFNKSWFKSNFISGFSEFIVMNKGESKKSLENFVVALDYAQSFTSSIFVDALAIAGSSNNEKIKSRALKALEEECEQNPDIDKNWYFLYIVEAAKSIKDERVDKIIKACESIIK